MTSDVLISINTEAGDARMHRDVAPRFNELRRTVREHSGVDFLAKCGDVLRPAGYVSAKDGVANRSWHKTGRAFDYDQTSHSLLLVSEPIKGQQFFRTWLICKDQTGKQGIKKHLRDIRGGSANAYVFDFTAAAKVAGFERIPAWAGWQTHYNRREFWHYQRTEGLTWDAAMLQLRGKLRPAFERVVGLNDRGVDVAQIQTQLVRAKYLAAGEIDGVFGAKTRLAVIEFQRRHGVDADGLVGPLTRKALGL